MFAAKVFELDDPSDADDLQKEIDLLKVCGFVFIFSLLKLIMYLLLIEMYAPKYCELFWYLQKFDSAVGMKEKKGVKRRGTDKHTDTNGILWSRVGQRYISYFENDNAIRVLMFVFIFNRNYGNN